MFLLYVFLIYIESDIETKTFQILYLNYTIRRIGMKKTNIFIYLLMFGFFYISFFGFVTEELSKRKLTFKTKSLLVNQAPVNKTVEHFQLQEKKQDVVELVLVGDVMLGRTVMSRTYEEKDFLYPFREIASEINDADIVFANLENPIIEKCPFTEKSLIFCATPQMLEGLKFAGINLVNLANNHTINYGNTGLDETIVHLKYTDIDYTGIGELFVKEVKGIGFGFLGFNYTFGYNAEMIQKDLELIKSSDSKVDYLIIGVHWGEEYQENPSDFQIEMARKMVESGADVIAGHHPHWIQKTEEVDGKLVYYSLGNFVFDQMWSEKTRTGLLVRLLISKDGVYEIKKENIYMENWAQPQLIQ